MTPVQLHVYHVSPALSVIEKETTLAVARLFGFDSHVAGGICQPGGSAANLTSVIVARHAHFPHIKSQGLGAIRPVIFTSSEAHYSLEKAAQIIGIGSSAVRAIPSDENGRMQSALLSTAIERARSEGFTPFYVSATSGTTVRGAYDPLNEIADICEREGLWMHVDASLGGGAVFSETHKHKLDGAHRARSITFNPHKMLGAPVTCSLLLARDLGDFWIANTLPAGYLFHDETETSKSVDKVASADAFRNTEADGNINEMYDLADLTPQCGRKGDALKLALGWIYHGRSGYEKYVDAAFSGCAYLTYLVTKHPMLELVGQGAPECVQVCFYFVGNTRRGSNTTLAELKRKNTIVTRQITKELVARGFMVDYAPGKMGEFLRVVVNGATEVGTLKNLVWTIIDIGSKLEV